MREITAVEDRAMKLRTSTPLPSSSNLRGMNPTLPTISLVNLLAALAPSLLLLLIMHHWSLKAVSALYANARMLVQLLAVGYVLTFVFETDRPALIVGVVLVMIFVSAWIALRPLAHRGLGNYSLALVSIAASGLTMLVIVTQWVLDLPRWFEPSFVVPLAGMIFANAMNTVSLAAERFESERSRGENVLDSRRTALDASLIPQINGLLAVGIVSLPGMMTGQILSGVEPMVAVRYQIMVMCMVFGSGGLGAAAYLALQNGRLHPDPDRYQGEM
jgi:putative ABC transport system permease protein